MTLSSSAVTRSPGSVRSLTTLTSSWTRRQRWLSDLMTGTSSRKWRTRGSRKSGKGLDRIHLLMNCELLRYRSTSESLVTLTQAAASRHSASGLQCRHRVSTSAPRSFLATRSLRVRSIF